MKICKELAEKEEVVHQVALAEYYFLGQEDYKKALYWALKSAEQADSYGMYILSQAYLRGLGVVKDWDEWP